MFFGPSLLICRAPAAPRCRRSAASCRASGSASTSSPRSAGCPASRSRRRTCRSRAPPAPCWRCAPSPSRGGCWPRCGTAGTGRSRAARLGRDVALAEVGALRGRQALRVAGRRHHADRSRPRLAREIRLPVARARRRRGGRSPRPAANRRGRTAGGVCSAGAISWLRVLLPGTAVGLPRHVRQRIERRRPGAARPRTPACRRRLARSLVEAPRPRRDSRPAGRRARRRRASSGWALNCST